MDTQKFVEMLHNQHFFDLKRMQHIYSPPEVRELCDLLQTGFYTALPIQDFNGNPLVMLESKLQISTKSLKFLLTPSFGAAKFGIKAMEEEIHSTLTIENIESSRDSIRRILNGYAPHNDSEERIYSLKKGLDFIANPENDLTEENIYKLYCLTINDFLGEEEKLPTGQKYRNDSVYIVGQKIEHEGLKASRLPSYMAEFVRFIRQESNMNDLVKAAIIHFYTAYLHPYFDGNGRMSRLLHLWYLVRQGYPAALFIPFSSYINQTRTAYYNAYTQIENNAKISNVLDITPFLLYFTENVYNRLTLAEHSENALDKFTQAFHQGKITEKEKALWEFVLSFYGLAEFSTKQLERDFGNAAYATIRSFVIKFEQMGLLQSQQYGNRVRYKIV